MHFKIFHLFKIVSSQAGITLKNVTASGEMHPKQLLLKILFYVPWCSVLGAFRSLGFGPIPARCLGCLLICNYVYAFQYLCCAAKCKELLTLNCDVSNRVWKQDAVVDAGLETFPQRCWEWYALSKCLCGSILHSQACFFIPLLLPYSWKPTNIIRERSKFHVLQGKWWINKTSGWMDAGGSYTAPDVRAIWQSAIFLSDIISSISQSGNFEHPQLICTQRRT